MNDSTDAQLWLRYAMENLRMAPMALDAGLYNPSLQNAQQATEEALKAIRAERGMPFGAYTPHRRTYTRQSRQADRCWSK